jgi:hypothetical protein
MRFHLSSRFRFGGQPIIPPLSIDSMAESSSLNSWKGECQWLEGRRAIAK